NRRPGDRPARIGTRGRAARPRGVLVLHRASFVVPACAWACVLGGSAAALAADPWADRVVSYEAGDEPAPGYTDPSRALGEPTRLAGVGVFPTAVTPFNPPWMPEELVSLGRGGSLVVAFDEPVTDDPLN